MAHPIEYRFSAKIFKVGINPCVKVPARITDKLQAHKGYIPVRGTIEQHKFQQTLVPVKADGYRLYVNGPMLKGANVAVGDRVTFVIQQDDWQRNRNHPMPNELKMQLKEHGLLNVFEQLAPSRQKEINRYLNNLKTEASLSRNVAKMILVLRGKTTSPLYRPKK